MNFNPNDWIPKTALAPRVPTSAGAHHPAPQNQFETLLQTIERRGVDIAPTYETWRNLGFALAAEFGERGREFFHRLSRFYDGYSSSAADKQYTRCLRGKQGITISTFYYLAKNAGVSI
ncbi:MAG: PriCT-2 domain-containing protein [Paludibacter sp.]|nr:PriCT-2 domain-containing protein [Paludibacter sp.]